jgi:hypothetical protein
MESESIQKVNVQGASQAESCQKEEHIDDDDIFDDRWQYPEPGWTVLIVTHILVLSGLSD